MDRIGQLTDLLRELPGIGPRQARRLAYWLVRRDSAWVTTLAAALTDARRAVRTCEGCARLFPAQSQSEALCGLCGDPRRDRSMVLVVEKEVDLENIERTGTYRGTYFVLGGTITALDKEPAKKIRLGLLQKTVASRAASTPPLTEIILALSATPDGEDTADVVSASVRELLVQHSLKLKLTLLGRGLSTGTELEYVDSVTMKNALRGRA